MAKDATAPKATPRKKGKAAADAPQGEPAAPPAPPPASRTAKPTTPTPEVATVASALPDRTICLELTFSRFGTRRKVSVENVEVEADKNLIRVAKRILDSKELKAVGQCDGRAKDYVRQLAVPSEITGDGVHLIPVALVERVEEKLLALSGERQLLVDTFIAEYPKLKGEAKARLKTLYDEKNYPSAEELKDYFAMDWRYLTLTVPDQLTGVSAMLWEREKEKAERRWVAAATEIQEALREAFRDLVKHMVDRLGVDEPDKKDGEPKKRVFKESMIEKMNTFLDTFQARNITDDGNLDALVQKARGLLKGVSAEELRKVDSVRETVRTEFSKIEKSMDKMVTTRSRGIRFDD